MNDKQRLAAPQAELVPQRPSPTLAARPNQGSLKNFITVSANEPETQVIKNKKVSNDTFLLAFVVDRGFEPLCRA